MGLVVLWVKGWDIIALSFLAGNLYLPFILIYLAIGFLMFKDTNGSQKALSKHKTWFLGTNIPNEAIELIPLLFIIAGIALSMIPAYLYHNQSIFQSIITYRVNFLFIAIPLLLKTNIRETHIVDALMTMTYIMIAVVIVREFVPALFVEPEVEQAPSTEEEIAYINGFTLPIFPLCYYLNTLRKKMDTKCVISVAACYFFLFIMQNRSTLFPVTLLFAWQLVQLKSEYRWIIYVAFGAIAMIVGIYTLTTWTDLWEQTIEELGDDDYNRNKAFLYFVYEASNNWLSSILGNGFLSANSSSTMADLMDDGIYNSDMGFIGYWNQYGLIPVFVFIYLCVYPFVKLKAAKHIQYLAFVIMTGCLSTSYFGNEMQLLFFAIYYILLICNVRKGKLLQLYKLQLKRKYKAIKQNVTTNEVITQ